MSRTTRCVATNGIVIFRKLRWALILLPLISMVSLIGCQPTSQPRQDLSEPGRIPEVFISSNLNVWDVLGRPESVRMALDLQTQRESNVLNVTARTGRDSCAFKFVLPNDASDEEIYKLFAEKTASFECFSATLAFIKADELRDVVRVFYRTLVPSASSTEYKMRQRHKPDKTTTSYHFDKLTKTPIYYSWQTTEDGCLKQSALKIRGLKEVSGIWTPRAADVVLRLHCDSPAARFFIDVQDTSIRREQMQNHNYDN